TKEDIIKYVRTKGESKQEIKTQSDINKDSTSTSLSSQEPCLNTTQSLVESPVPVVKQSGSSTESGDEIIEVDRMRKLIADHMLSSIKTSAHVSSFVEADVTNIVNWRNKNKDIFHKREGTKITFTPIFIEAIA